MRTNEIGIDHGAMGFGVERGQKSTLAQENQPSCADVNKPSRWVDRDRGVHRRIPDSVAALTCYRP